MGVHPGGSGHPVDQAQSQGDESRRLTGEYVTVIMKHSTKLGVCPSNFPALASKSVPLRAPASPAQSVRGEASEGGQSPPPSYLGCRGQVPEKDLPPAA